MSNKYLEKIAGPQANFLRMAISRTPPNIAGKILTRVSTPVKLRKVLPTLQGDIYDVGRVVNGALQQ